MISSGGAHASGNVVASVELPDATPRASPEATMMPPDEPSVEARPDGPEALLLCSRAKKRKRTKLEEGIFKDLKKYFTKLKKNENKEYECDVCDAYFNSNVAWEFGNADWDDDWDCCEQCLNDYKGLL